MSERTKKLEEVFHRASELSAPEQRESYLDEACLGEADLRGEVEALLKAAPAGDELFQPSEQSSMHSGGVLIAPVTERAGTVIGRYKLLEKIGEGGMGVVYMAEQELPIRRKVALKIIKLGMDTRQVIARFEAERQALAMMEHPHIAQVLDAGATETGRPYFVMELVQGVPITEFCDADKLSIRERLNLFIPVCHAIQSAHQKGIIHRDIKPSNVLVTMHNGTPHPMVIDFGVAKATNQKLTEKTLFTNFATMIGTPAYMSPEQAEMSKLDVDTRSDIYSLGVLLYELLTGTTPFSEERLRSVAYGEMQRIISQEEPERPSTRRIGTARTKSVIRDSRPQIDSDLDWVVMKCLEKDRNRRYDTANALAGDIQAHLNDEPVLARPPSMAYRFQKFVRRNRTASTAVALITLAVLLGIIASSWALFRERAARRQSEERLTAALAFVDDVFNKVAPKLENLAGAADAQERLGEAGLKFIKRLRSGAATDPAIRLALARLLNKRALAQNPGSANPTGEYNTGLMCAREAAQLLESKSLPASEDERLILLWSAKLAEVQCLYGLGRVEEGISHLDELDRLLDQLAKVPQFGPRMANRYHRTIRNNAGNNTMIAGRPREAIERFFLPGITNDWARSITTNSWDIEIESVMNPNGNMVVAHLLLKEFDAMLPYAKEAARLIDVLVQRSPRNARWLRYRVMNLAHHGYAVVRSGDIVAGLAELKKGRDEAEAHAKLDPANDQIAQVRAIVAALQAMALAFWSEEASADLSERRRRLTEGVACLAEAEKLSGKTMAVDFKIYLSRASEDIAAAKSNLLSASTAR